LLLPAKLANVGWKVKIHDNERCEDPHVTIWFKMRKWRLKLRDQKFLDGGSWKEIDKGVRAIIEANWRTLRTEWDRRYGDVNPISSEEDEEEN
jgi:hypothetical protein